MTRALTAFLKKVGEDDALFTEFAALAAKHGFDLTELEEGELEGVAGGSLTIKKSELTEALLDSEMDLATSGIQAAREQYKAAIGVITQVAEQETEAAQKAVST